MDSSITQGYENTGNVSDVNKQVSYAQNTMEYGQENFPAEAQIESEGFHVEGDPYNVPHDSAMYNPNETVQQIEFNQQDPDLQNLQHDTYFTPQATQVQEPYIPEEALVQESAVEHTNNGIVDAETVQAEQLEDNYAEVSNTEINETEVNNSEANNVDTSNREHGNVALSESEVAEVQLIVEHNTDNFQALPDDVNIEAAIQPEEIPETSSSDSKQISGDDMLTTTSEDTQNQSLEGTIIEENKVQDLTDDGLVETTDNMSVNDETVQEPVVNEEEKNEITLEVSSDNVGTEPVQKAVGGIIEETAEVEQPTGANFIELQNYNAGNDQEDQYIFIEESTSEPTVTGVTTSDQVTSSDQVQANDVEVEEVSTTSAEKPNKQRRTRKPVHDLPMHLIGHDISKPVEAVPNGRSLPKPRLGVKVPYLNLTSQIVSKAELEEEIIERSRQKEQINSQKTKNRFARSLTQRLANKITPEKDKHKKTSKEEGYTSLSGDEDDPMVAKPEVASTVDDTKIENDDDLLAILEGDGDEIPVLSKGHQESEEIDDSNLKLLEREIALQQLQELPHQEPTERIVRPRFPKTAPPLAKTEIQPTKHKQSTPSKPATKPVSQPNPEHQSKAGQNSKVSNPNSKSSDQSKSEKSVKSDQNKSEKNAKSDQNKSEKSAKSDQNRSDQSQQRPSSIDLDSSQSEKKPVEVEPQVKVNMVLKTYSRKRKPSDISEFDIPSPKRSAFEDPDANQIYEKGDPLALPSDVYVTKSSRVIKKKVIWDPDDEQSPKSVKPSVKIVDSIKSTSAKVSKTTPEKSERKSGEKIKSEQKSTPKLSEKNSTEKNISKKKVLNQKSPLKSKRGLSEVDRLLMDEGAVKMLYDLKGDETPAKKKKAVYSVERAEKEIIKKASMLKNDLVQNTGSESQKSLRKKEALAMVSTPVKQPIPILERKMSKDSTKSSVHTPPRSPNFFSSQASMLIRRRSSSSLSSDSDHEEQPKVVKSSKKTESSKSKKQKKTSSNDNNNSTPNKDAKTTKPAKEATLKTMKGPQYKSFTMRKSGKHVSIDLNYIDDSCHFTILVLDELTTALKRLEKDKECNVVSITSTSKAFCLGLDYASLVTENKNDRVEKATMLAESVRQFLLSLLSFPKVLVAGIQGECLGLGVTMLSLFDTVIASDTATFRTPYASMGCLGEATFLLMYPNLNSNGLAAELLYADQMLKADEAFRRGLISKLCWPEKYKDTLGHFLTSVANGSRQSLETTKRQLRVNVKDQIEAAINDEVEILVDHWTSPECQENFSKLRK